MRTPPFRGLGVAMVTPFTRDGAVDEPRLRALVDWLIESGVDALLPVGSTGEGATLTHEEHRRVMTSCWSRRTGACPCALARAVTPRTKPSGWRSTPNARARPPCYL